MERIKNNDVAYEFLEDIDLSLLDIVHKNGGVWADKLIKWEETDAKAIKFLLKSERERVACKTAIRSYIKKHHYDWTLYSERSTYNIYVVRA